MTNRAKAGDIYAIPLKDGGQALCRVLYKSSYFKHVALVGCYGLYSASVSCATQMKSGLLGTPLYTTVQPIKIRDWRLIENHPLSPEEHVLSRRLVGGEVWIADKHLGTPVAADTELPKMLTHGEHVFLKKLAELLSSSPAVHADPGSAVLRR